MKKSYSKNTISLAMATLLWGSGVYVGFKYLSGYSNTPGAVGPISQIWPVDSKVDRDLTAPTLIVFAHPKCPCTRATAAELALLMSRVEGFPVTTYVYLFTPQDVEKEWVETDLKGTFEKIPHVKVVLDLDGQEAKRFGALTSGQVVLYSQNGKLLFRGGITESRGHEGENDGLDSVDSLIKGKTSKNTKTSVFGCAIQKAVSTL